MGTVFTPFYRLRPKQREEVADSQDNGFLHVGSSQPKESLRDLSRGPWCAWPERMPVLDLRCPSLVSTWPALPWPAQGLTCLQRPRRGGGVLCKKVPCVWSEDLGCLNNPSVSWRFSLPERGLGLCAPGLGRVRQGRRAPQVWVPAGLGCAGWAWLCFPAQLSANDRAPAGRNTTEPGLHMCGWAEDNCRCSWNSQTGYKIASRMQRKRKEPSVLHNEKLASRPVAAVLRRRQLGPPVPEGPGIRKPACVCLRGSALLQQPAFSGFWSVSVQDPRLSSSSAGCAGSALPPEMPWRPS